MPGRPIELTETQRGEIETLAALLNQQQIADYLGISRRCFQSMLARDPDIEARYKRGKAKAIAHVAKGLLQKARAGCTTSSIFYLKTQAGWRETDRLEHRLSGPEDGRDAETGTEAAVARFVARLNDLAGRQQKVIEALPLEPPCPVEEVS